MSGLRKFVAPEFIFGEGARKLVGQYACNLGANRILLVTDPGIIASGWLDDVISSLESEGLQCTVFSAVTPNPKSEEVMAGADIYKSNKCNAIVALGGGSPIDCAKGIAIVSTNHRHILSFEGVDKVEVPMPPLICVPTTAGTSADVSQFCIIASRQDKIKIAIISKAVIPDISLIDPVTTTTMDSYLTACTGMDALTHAIEAFVSTGSSMMTDIHALEAIKIISKNLIEAVRKPDDINLRNKIMYGSLEAGLAFSNAILGAVHAMSHSLGGLLDLPHGECNSVLLEHVISFNFNAVPGKFNVIAEAMGLDLRGMSTLEKKKAFLSYINKLRKNVGIDKTLSKMGVTASDINNLAKNAINDACMHTNPRPAVERDIEVIYEEAL